MNEELTNVEVEETEFPVEETFEENTDIIPDSEEKQETSNSAALIVGAVVVGGLAMKGAKEITKQYVIPGAKKAVSAIASVLPFGKKKKKNKKQEEVVADVEIEEEEIKDYEFEDEE